MGTAIHVVVEGGSLRTRELVLRANGKALAAAIEELDERARKLGLTPLMQFFSADPDDLREMLADEPDAVDIPARTWFPPGAGLRTVRGLIAAVRDDREGIGDVAGVLADLSDVEAALTAAEADGASFHIAIDV